MQVYAIIETLWQEQLAKNPLLFNGCKVRLTGNPTKGDYSAGNASPIAVVSYATDGSDGGGGKGGGGGSGRGAGKGRMSPLQLPRSRSPSSPPTNKWLLRLGYTDYRTN